MKENPTYKNKVNTNGHTSLWPSFVQNPPRLTKEAEIQMEDDRKFIPDPTFMREFFTHRTSYFLVRRDSNNKIIEAGMGEEGKDNVASAAMWLKYGRADRQSVDKSTREVYEVCAHRGIRLMGAST